MGMFDEVRHPCPCGGTFEWQSKAHDCVLRAWNLEDPNLPAVVLTDIAREVGQCVDCGTSAVIHMIPAMRPVVEILR